MAKIKAAGTGKKKKSSFRAAFPCFALLVLGMFLFFLLLYGVFRGGQ